MHVVSISHKNSFVQKFEYINELKRSFKDSPYYKKSMPDGIKYKWKFMLVDPFDRTYNPGKTIRSNKGDESNDYIYAFKT